MQNHLDNHSQAKITYFPDQLVKDIALPERFTFPFYYEPHPLTRIAAAQLQQYLEEQASLDHNFGLDSDQEGMAIGKMFGVLVVQDTEGKVGYLSAFSGKLAGSNDHPNFVPPVFDMLVENSFFLKEQENINTLNAQVKEIWADTTYTHLRQQLDQFSTQSSQEIAALKKQLKVNKQNRKKLREEQQNKLNLYDYGLFEAYLVKHSLHDKHQLKVLTDQWEQLLDKTRESMAQFESRIEALKNERKERSADLQRQLFEQYAFLNRDGKSKSLQDIFSVTAFGKPPAGAGECATPKLLQFAFANGYKPLAMAEFWWGASPKSEIRKHKQFYPACTGKCKPILGHMLEGMPVDDNPLLLNPGENTKLEIIYEDACFVIVNKPAGLRSVRGVDIHDSVYTRLKQVLVNTEPLIVHRLDMGTSGLLVVAKTPEAHKHIQKQFLNRTLSKRYVALLSKVIDKPEGEISLPLTGDPYNRPRQLVCFETGKKSITRWQVVYTTETTTKIHFWPLTGRTHQLRMHSAHELGLNAPIVGDDLYGTPAERLYLHAAYLEFVHPETKERISFEVTEDF
ncbi:RluA family pseudouridine synthase [Mucilaginibacter sp. Bleaf8]|uniref:RluA family pseudouridine synthase n=1 Tax=Mucilaginibacter sp. Bleaf8 TaxID=2834430 RepID=UPI001BCC5EAB|nr:RluA family pseudouridine synthase [Mucilaginibacter sp. Bleaf8]MBS7566716.1 RluA family pseudouridine synthase [Mucilaginibacter sp. Bleaf8]